MTQAAESLPEGWVRAWDNDRSSVYYCNAALGLTQWTPPTGASTSYLQHAAAGADGSVEQQWAADGHVYDAEAMLAADAAEAAAAGAAAAADYEKAVAAGAYADPGAYASAPGYAHAGAWHSYDGGAAATGAYSGATATGSTATGDRSGLYCRDTYGVIQGPFSVGALHEWRPYLPMDMRVWMVEEYNFAAGAAVVQHRGAKDGEVAERLEAIGGVGAGGEVGTSGQEQAGEERQDQAQAQAHYGQAAGATDEAAGAAEEQQGQAEAHAQRDETAGPTGGAAAAGQQQDQAAQAQTEQEQQRQAVGAPSPSGVAVAEEEQPAQAHAQQEQHAQMQGQQRQAADAPSPTGAVVAAEDQAQQEQQQQEQQQEQQEQQGRAGMRAEEVNVGVPRSGEELGSATRKRPRSSEGGDGCCDAGGSSASPTGACVRLDGSGGDRAVVLRGEEEHSPDQALNGTDGGGDGSSGGAILYRMGEERTPEQLRPGVSGGGGDGSSGGGDAVMLRGEERTLEQPQPGDISGSSGGNAAVPLSEERTLEQLHLGGTGSGDAAMPLIQDRTRDQLLPTSGTGAGAGASCNGSSDGSIEHTALIWQDRTLEQLLEELPSWPFADLVGDGYLLADWHARIEAGTVAAGTPAPTAPAYEQWLLYGALPTSNTVSVGGGGGGADVTAAAAAGGSAAAAAAAAAGGAGGASAYVEGEGEGDGGGAVDYAAAVLAGLPETDEAVVMSRLAASAGKSLQELVNFSYARGVPTPYWAPGAGGYEAPREQPHQHHQHQHEFQEPQPQPPQQLQQQPAAGLSMIGPLPRPPPVTTDYTCAMRHPHTGRLTAVVSGGDSAGVLYGEISR
ncbi:hypothetical protein FOA52_006234 [Chlamydomonas sp. UWO 241]|nr:hypothetical protein FOA52_006234 [Chlamydomonas sp. UWO 241]